MPKLELNLLKFPLGLSAYEIILNIHYTQEKHFCCIVRIQLYNQVEFRFWRPIILEVNANDYKKLQNLIQYKLSYCNADADSSR